MGPTISVRPCEQRLEVLVASGHTNIYPELTSGSKSIVLAMIAATQFQKSIVVGTFMSAKND